MWCHVPWHCDSHRRRSVAITRKYHCLSLAVDRYRRFYKEKRDCSNTIRPQKGYTATGKLLQCTIAQTCYVVTWLPCEVEALSIGAAIKHFAPFIIQLSHATEILTDYRPCVQAYEKLMRGEISSSSRVTTFLSTASRYRVYIRHIDGVANLPSYFRSRNPRECHSSYCQVCKFVQPDRIVGLSSSVQISDVLMLT